MSSGQKGQDQRVTELTEEFYKREEEADSTGHTALQSDSQAIYVSISRSAVLAFKIHLSKDILSRRGCGRDSCFVVS